MRRWDKTTTHVPTTAPALQQHRFAVFTQCKMSENANPNANAVSVTMFEEDPDR